MSDATEQKKPPRLWVRILIFVLLVAVVVMIYILYGDALRLENLVDKESQLRDYQSEHPVLVYGLAFVVYVTVTSPDVDVPFVGAALVQATCFSLMHAPPSRV